MKYSIQLLFAALIIIMAACKTEKKTEDGYVILPDGLEVKLTEDKKGHEADSGDMIKMHINLTIGDSVIFDSKKVPNPQPIPAMITKSANVSDLMNGFKRLSLGDKAIFRLTPDSVFKGPAAAQKPPFIKEGDMMVWNVEVMEIETLKDREEAKKKALAEEKGNIENYLKEKGIKGANATASGMYIQTVTEGTGEQASVGKKVTMNYTGYLLDGSVFDSNQDPKFGHTDPFTFGLGTGQVIKGWDEGVAAMKVGGKAKFIIPSELGYGGRAMPGNDNNPKGIPANSTLVFDVELLKVEDMPQQPQQGQIQAVPQTK